jgi:hypothetical protein
MLNSIIKHVKVKSLKMYTDTPDHMLQVWQLGRPTRSLSLIPLTTLKVTIQLHDHMAQFKVPY